MSKAAAPKKRRRVVGGAVEQAPDAVKCGPQLQLAAWARVRVGTAGFISKLLQKLFARSRLQVRDNGNLVRFTLWRTCSACMCSRAFPSMRARPCAADSAEAAIIVQVAKAFLRDRASHGQLSRSIRVASWDGDVYSIAAALDAGELVDDFGRSMGCRAGAASSDAVDMRSQPIMPPCFTSCFRDPKNRPLLLAIRESHENSNAEAVKMLIANGASTGGVYENENLYNDVPSPLILAIRKGQRDFVAMLLEHAASVDERECGWRLEYPLHAAVYSQDFEILKALLKKGPKVDCLDFFGHTPLHCACQVGWFEGAFALVHRGASLCAIQQIGFTALHYASRYGHPDIAERICLLHEILAEEDHSSWINLPDVYGSTPLLLAGRCGHLETVRALLRHGAAASDKILREVLHYAQLNIPAVSHNSEDTSRMDLLRLRENLDDMSLALRKALLKQRYDAECEKIGC